MSDYIQLTKDKTIIDVLPKDVDRYKKAGWTEKTKKQKPKPKLKTEDN